MIEARSNTVMRIVAYHLCCGCGTCVAVCPTRALSMTETPAGFLVAQMVDESACTACGLCLQVCPGAVLTDESEATFEALSDPFVGNISAAYWGWALTSRVRCNGASGGLVTALVEHLMRSGTAQAALVTRWSPDDPQQHEAFIAHTPEDLNQSQKSRYCPVALNAHLCELMGLDRVAIVGLPCHLHGIEHAARLLDLPETVRIGLFCERTLSRLLIDRLKSAAGVQGAMERFEYRHKGQRGWPGDVYIRPQSGEGVSLDRSERMKRKDIYTPVRCRLCFDKFNVLADIACGDGYGAPHTDEGASALLVRTPQGEAVVAGARDELHLDQVATDILLRAHHPKQRQSSCMAYAAAFRDQHPDAPDPLPRVCRCISDAPSYRIVKRCRDTIFQGIQFEDATDRAQAVRMARNVELRQYPRAIWLRLRGLLVRGLKLILRRQSI